MNRKKGFWMLTGCVILLAVLYFITTRPKQLDLTSPTAVNAITVLERMYQLKETIYCVSDAKVDLLAEVVIDSPEYQSSSEEKNLIEKYFGKEGLTHPGLLTKMQAERLSRGELIYVFCNEGWDNPRDDQRAHYHAVLVGREGKIIVLYELAGGEYQATLRSINGKLFITNIKNLKPPRG